MAHPIYKAKDGKRLPSVTTVLGHRMQPGGLLRWYWQLGKEGRDPELEKNSAARAGTVKHALAEVYLGGKDPLEALAAIEADQHEKDQGLRAFETWRSWYEAQTIDVLSMEVSLVSERYRFGGTMDAVGRDSAGRLVLLDWKTSSKIRVDAVYQVAAYSWLWEEVKGEPVFEARIVRSDKEEAGKLEEVVVDEEHLRAAWEGFLALLDVYLLDRKLDKEVLREVA